MPQKFVRCRGEKRQEYYSYLFQLTRAIEFTKNMREGEYSVSYVVRNSIFHR